jgi:hypothetical protein
MPKNRLFTNLKQASPLGHSVGKKEPLIVTGTHIEPSIGTKSTSIKRLADLSNPDKSIKDPEKTSVSPVEVFKPIKISQSTRSTLQDLTSIASTLATNAQSIVPITSELFSKVDYWITSIKKGETQLKKYNYTVPADSFNNMVVKKILDLYSKNQITLLVLFEWIIQINLVMKSIKIAPLTEPKQSSDTIALDKFIGVNADIGNHLLERYNQGVTSSSDIEKIFNEIQIATEIIYIMQNSVQQ